MLPILCSLQNSKKLTMNNKYTNKETSKQLKEWGCLLESDKS